MIKSVWDYESYQFSKKNGLENFARGLMILSLKRKLNVGSKDLLDLDVGCENDLDSNQKS